MILELYYWKNILRGAGGWMASKTCAMVHKSRWRSTSQVTHHYHRTHMTQAVQQHENTKHELIKHGVQFRRHAACSTCSLVTKPLPSRPRSDSDESLSKPRYHVKDFAAVKCAGLHKMSASANRACWNGLVSVLSKSRSKSSPMLSRVFCIACKQCSTGAEHSGSAVHTKSYWRLSWVETKSGKRWTLKKERPYACACTVYSYTHEHIHIHTVIRTKS